MIAIYDQCIYKLTDLVVFSESESKNLFQLTILPNIRENMLWKLTSCKLKIRAVKRQVTIFKEVFRLYFKVIVKHVFLTTQIFVGAK